MVDPNELNIDVAELNRASLQRGETDHLNMHDRIGYARSVLSCGLFEAAAKNYDERLVEIDKLDNVRARGAGLCSIFLELTFMDTNLPEEQREVFEPLREKIDVVRQQAEECGVSLSGRCAIFDKMP